MLVGAPQKAGVCVCNSAGAEGAVDVPSAREVGVYLGEAEGVVIWW
jgi:hypothetical protein